VTPSFSLTSSREKPIQKGFIHTYSASFSLSTTIYGLSVFGIGPIRKFRHVFSPSFSLTSSGNLREGSSQGELSFYLSNIYEAKLREEKKLTLINSDLSFSYKLKKKEISPLRMHLDILPDIPTQIKVDLTYNLRKRKVEEISQAIEFSISRELEEERKFKFYFRGTRSWRIDGYSTKTIGVDLSLPPTKNWSLRYSISVDMEREKIIDQSIIIRRDLHCWVLELRWARFGPSYNYDFKIWIKSLPDVKFKRSLFEAFLPP